MATERCVHLGGAREPSDPQLYVCEVFGSCSPHDPAAEHTCVDCEKFTRRGRPGQCLHRGEFVREEVSKVCGSKGTIANVFTCSKHGECSAFKFCRRQTVRNCSFCEDR